MNHCVNDIAVLGARPLFFLDYIGCEKLEPRVFDQLLRGFSRACRSAGCALIGGETAQMPGMYRKGEYDLAGCIVGVVDRPNIIDGRKIKPGDTILGLAVEWFAHKRLLARTKNFSREDATESEFAPPRIDADRGEELLRVHKNYQPLLAKVPAGMIKGLAHITGGGLIDNLPRVLPKNCDAVIETKRWRVPRIFQILQRNGDVDRRGDVSGLQHGDWNGGNCFRARHGQSHVDVESETNWPNRARLRQDATVLYADVDDCR